MLDVFSDTHHWIADEPTRSGGNNAGPDPYEHLLASIGTCTSMTLRMYALTDEQRARLMEIADKCPVHRTLSGKLEIRTSNVAV